LRVVGFEEGFIAQPDRFVQRIVAIREASDTQYPVRYAISN